MTLRIALSVAEVVVVVAVLAWFLVRLTTMLSGVADKLGSISGGVRAIEGHCAGVGPPATTIIENLGATAAGLASATVIAERLGR